MQGMKAATENITHSRRGRKWQSFAMLDETYRNSPKIMRGILGDARICSVKWELLVGVCFRKMGNEIMLHAPCRSI